MANNENITEKIEDVFKDITDYLSSILGTQDFGELSQKFLAAQRSKDKGEMQRLSKHIIRLDNAQELERYRELEGAETSNYILSEGLAAYDTDQYRQLWLYGNMDGDYDTLLEAMQIVLREQYRSNDVGTNARTVKDMEDGIYSGFFTGTESYTSYRAMAEAMDVSFYKVGDARAKRGGDYVYSNFGLTQRFKEIEEFYPAYYRLGEGSEKFNMRNTIRLHADNALADERLANEREMQEEQTQEQSTALQTTDNKSIWNTIKEKISGIGDYFSGIFSGSKKFAQEVISSAENGLSDIGEQVRERGQNVLEEVQQFIDENVTGKTESVGENTRGSLTELREKVLGERDLGEKDGYAISDALRDIEEGRTTRKTSEPDQEQDEPYTFHIK